MDVSARLDGCIGFQWDDANLPKVWKRHAVSAAECEQAFFNVPLMAAPDDKHSAKEPRFYMLGRTNMGRCLFVVFTIRGGLIRVVSARDMNRRERRLFEAL